LTGPALIDSGLTLDALSRGTQDEDGLIGLAGMTMTCVGLILSTNATSAELSELMLSFLCISTLISTSGLGDLDLMPGTFRGDIPPPPCEARMLGASEIDRLSLVSSQRALRRRVPSTISSQTAVTYLGVAPRRMRASGEKPSCKRLRMMSIYCRASDSEITDSPQHIFTEIRPSMEICTDQEEQKRPVQVNLSLT
jgi:hypothetical protein